MSSSFPTPALATGRNYSPTSESTVRVDGRVQRSRRTARSVSVNGGDHAVREADLLVHAFDDGREVVRRGRGRRKETDGFRSTKQPRSVRLAPGLTRRTRLALCAAPARRQSRAQRAPEIFRAGARRRVAVLGDVPVDCSSVAHASEADPQ